MMQYYCIKIITLINHADLLSDFMEIFSAAFENLKNLLAAEIRPKALVGVVCLTS